MATSEPGNVAELGRRGFVMVSVFTGAARAKQATDIYRKAWRETHAEPLPEHRLGYSAFFAVADSDEEALRLVEKCNWFHSVAGKVAPQYNKFLPGFYSEDRLLDAWRNRGQPMDLSPASLIARGLIFAGNPDTVARQVKAFRRAVGGLGHLVIQIRQGFVTHAEAVKSTRSQRARCCRNCRTSSRSIWQPDACRHRKALAMRRSARPKWRSFGAARERRSCSSTESTTSIRRRPSSPGWPSLAR